MGELYPQNLLNPDKQPQRLPAGSAAACVVTCVLVVVAVSHVAIVERARVGDLVDLVLTVWGSRLVKHRITLDPIWFGELTISLAVLANGHTNYTT